MAAKLATTGCWLGKKNSDLESVLPPYLHPDYVEAVLRWLLRTASRLHQAKDSFNCSGSLSEISFGIVFSCSGLRNLLEADFGPRVWLLKPFLTLAPLETVTKLTLKASAISLFVPDF